MIITSFQEELLHAPANPTSAWNNPFGAVTYGAAIPVGFGGLGAVVYNKGRAVKSYSGADVPGEESGGISGLGQFDPTGVTQGVAAGLSIAQMVGNFLQPNQTGIFAQDATTLANGLAAELQSIDAALASNPTCANKDAAINFFWQAWDELVQGCSRLGGPGTKCVNERAINGKYSWWKDHLNPWTAMQCTTPTVQSNNGTSAGSGSMITPTGVGGSSVVNVGGIGIDLSNPLVLGIIGISAYALFSGGKG